MGKVVANWKNNRVNMKLMSAFSILIFILMILEIIILSNHIPYGYDITIYNQISSPFWYILIPIYFGGVYLVLQGENTLTRKIGILILLINYFIFLITPYFLQYYSMNRRDTLTNLGQLIEIISGSHISPDNFYPATHIVLGSIAVISGIQPNMIGILLPIFFSFIFIIGEYSFSRLLISETEARYLLIPVLTIFYFRGYHFLMSPQYMYMMVVPIVLVILYKYLFSKNNRVSIEIVFTIFIMSISFEHPFIFIFIFYILSLLVCSTRFSITPIFNADKALKLLGIIFILWLTMNQVLLKGSADIIKNLAGDMPFAAMQGTMALQSGIHKVLFADFLVFLFLLYGRYIVPILFIFLFLFMLIKNKGHMENFVGSYYYILALFIIFGIMDLFILFNPFIQHVFERITTLNFFIYALIPLFSLSLYLILLKNKNQKSILMVAVILTIIFSMSLFGAHESPSTFLPNDAITYNEVLGMSWIMCKRDVSYSITDVLNNQEEARFYDLFFGRSHRPLNLTYNFMPDHFGYNDDDFTLKYQYITISGYDEFLDKILSKLREPNPFSSEDFKKFRADNEINKIYDSLDIEIYKT